MRPGGLITRRRFLRLGATAVLGGIGMTSGGYVYARHIEPGWIELTELQLSVTGLGPAFDGYRIAHFSDVHMDHLFMTEERLRSIADLVNAQSPDLVAVTGDFVTFDPVDYYAEALIGGLSALNAPDGVVAVLGNHDYWTNARAVRRILADAGVHELRNSSRTITRGGDTLHVGGVDDVYEGQARLGNVLGELPDDSSPALILAHEPDFADTIGSTHRFFLQLSGHSHGGQIRAPFLPPLRLPRWGQKYHTGLYRVYDMSLYTNRGVGMVPPQFRLFCRPEITLYTLHTEG